MNEKLKKVQDLFSQYKTIFAFIGTLIAFIGTLAAIFIVVGNYHNKVDNLEVTQKTLTDRFYNLENKFETAQRTLNEKIETTQNILIDKIENTESTLNSFIIEFKVLQGQLIGARLIVLDDSVTRSDNMIAFSLMSTPEDWEGQLIGARLIALDDRVTRSDYQAKISQVLNEIENQSEFYFLYNHKLIDMITFSQISTPEDWEGFKKLMEESAIQEKDLILRVLSMHYDPVVREKEIKNIIQAFKEIREEILPQLRRFVLITDIDTIIFPKNEIFVVKDTNILFISDSIDIKAYYYLKQLQDTICMNAFLDSLLHKQMNDTTFIKLHERE